MKVKYALMACMFSLASLGNAQEVAKSTEVLEALSAPVPPVTLSLEQRNAKLSTLALIPADTSACFAVLGLGQIFVDMENACTPVDEHNRARRMKSQENTRAFKELIIAGGHDLPTMITNMAPLLCAVEAYVNRLYSFGVLETILGVVDIGERKNMSPPEAALLKGLSAWLQKGGFAPALVIARIDQPLMDEVKSNMQQMVADVCDDSIITRHQLMYQDIEFSGIVFNGQVLVDSVGKEIFDTNLSLDMTRAEKELLLKAIAKVNVYILVGFKDDKMIVSITQDPSKQLNLAATPQESILATDHLAFTDHVAAPSVLGYIDVPTSKALLNLREIMSQSMVQSWAKSLESLAQEWNLGDVAGVVSALKAYDRHYQELLKMSQATKPMTFLAWLDKGVQIEASIAKQSSLVMDKPLKLSSFADRPENILYAAAALNPQYSSTFIKLCESGGETAWQLASLIFANTRDKTSSESLQMFTLLQMCKPELIQIWNSAKLAFSGMDNEAILIVDNKGTMPKGIPLPEGAQLTVPRFAYAKGITDRSKISEAWEAMVTSIDSLVASLSSPEEMSDATDESLTPKKKEVKGVMTYSYPFAFFTADCDPCLSISDKVFVVGSSPQLNQDVAEAMIMPQTGNLKGAAFVLKMPSLFAMLKSMPLLSIAGDLTDFDAFLTPSERIDAIDGVVTENESMNIRISIPFK